MVGKAKWKPLELPLHRKMENQNQYHIPGAITERVPPSSDRIIQWVVIPTTSPFSGLCRRQILENYSGLSQTLPGSDPNHSY